MLQNAVHDSKPLRDVKDTAIQLEAVSKVKTMYQEYTNLLLAKCSTIDTDLSVKPTRMPKQLVYNTDINPTEDEVTTTNEIDSFGIDCDAHTLLGNCTPNLWCACNANGWKDMAQALSHGTGYMGPAQR